MGIFDTHAHYHDARFSEDLEELLASMPHPNEVDPLGVDGILECACDLDSSRFADALSRLYDFVYDAVGCHPSDAERFEDFWL
ncbi:MAG: TatD family hydrolase, partial [Clostridia bacterium]|nr:TatD family hydrolase [Clostridia bacterium]